MPGVVESRHRQRPLLAYRMATASGTYMVLAYFEGDAKLAFEEAVEGAVPWDFSQMAVPGDFHFRLHPYHRMHRETQVTIEGPLRQLIPILRPDLVYRIEPLPSIREPVSAPMRALSPVPIWQHIKEDPFSV